MSTNKQLNLTNLVDLDNGKVVAAFNHALRQILADISDRPGDRTKRKAVLTVIATPRIDKDLSVLDGSDIQFQVKAQIPVRQSKPYPMLLTADNTAMFQPESPDNPRQAALPYTTNVDRSTGEVIGDDDADVGEM